MKKLHRVSWTSLLASALLALGPALVAAGCSNGDGSSGGAADYSGSYSTNLGGEPRYLLTLTQTGSTVTWGLSGAGISLSGSGTVSANVVTITQTTPFAFSSTLTFKTLTDFNGTFTVSGQAASNGTMSGSTTAPSSYSLPLLGTPRFVANDYIELAKITQLSYLRSSAGHSFTDDFESCRSMKHYYVPDAAVNWAQIVITSPVDGTITGWTDEGSGLKLGIESSLHPGIHFVVFHVNPSIAIDVGTALTAGQVIGTHIGSQTHSDIAVGVVEPTGSYRLISYLDTTTDSLFANYQARGLTTRTGIVHSQAARDADPLTCNGETFTSTGTLPSYFPLN